MLLSEIKSKLPLFFFLPILLTVIYVPAKNSLINTYYYTKPWNYNQLGEWLSKNPLDAPIAAHPTDLMVLGLSPVQTEFTHGGAFSMAEHLENRAQYALINTDWSANTFYGWMRYRPKNIQTRWNKPLDELGSSYAGLALEELLHYQIFAAVKPWQAPEANLILIEFPKWPKGPMKKIFAVQGMSLSQTNHGKTSLNPIPVKSGLLYKVSANLKSQSNLESHERDGFIIVDFGKTNCVSARVTISGLPKKDVYCLAPDGVEALMVSLQVENDGNIVQANDIEVWESEGVVKKASGRYPYIENNVELDIIYPNSQANL